MTREIKFRAWNVKEKFFSGLSFQGGEGDCFCGVKSPFVIWSQYTGLKDKNGEEIYESDRVEFNPLGSNEILEGIVQWYKEGWVIDDGIRKFELWSGIFGQPKVIGNIYENPELCPNNSTSYSVS